MSVEPSAQSVIERLTEELHDVAATVAGQGHAFARTYIAAAMTSLRLARAALLADGEPLPRSGLDFAAGVRRVAFANGMPTPIFLAPRGDVHVRGHWVDSMFEVRADADVSLPPVRSADLACDLFGSARARELSLGPVGASLLADAVGTRSWKHPSSPDPWSVGRLAARAIVTTLRGGDAVRPLAPELSGTTLDCEVLKLIESLGWRRHVGEMDVVRPADRRG